MVAAAASEATAERVLLLERFEADPEAAGFLTAVELGRRHSNATTTPTPVTTNWPTLSEIGAEATIRYLAAMHAAFWQGADPAATNGNGAGDLVEPAGADPLSPLAAVAALAGFWHASVAVNEGPMSAHHWAHVRERLAARHDRTAQGPSLDAVLAMAPGAMAVLDVVGDASAFESIARVIAARFPLSLTHRDVHVANVLARPGEGATPDLCVVDWTIAKVDCSLFDLAYLLAFSVEIETRRRHEDAWLAVYADTLVDHGVDRASVPLSAIREWMEASAVQAALFPIMMASLSLQGSLPEAPDSFWVSGLCTRRWNAVVADWDLERRAHALASAR